MTGTDWTDDRIERMSAMWLQGLSASAIARALGGGATRSAVLGKLHRLGVRRGPAPEPRSVAKAPRNRPRGATTRGRPKAANPRVASADARVDREDALTPLATLTSIGRGRCRWPYGDPVTGELPVCGRDVSRGAYCDCHAAFAYQGRRLVSVFKLAGLAED